MSTWTFLNILFLLQGFLHFNAGAEWKAEIPQKISAFKSSCVVIPCKFFYKGSPRSREDISAIWYKVYNNQDVRVYDSYKTEDTNRVSLIGDLETNNCSLQIMDIQLEDAKLYKYRVQIKGLENFSYKEHVMLQIQDGPEKPTIQMDSEIMAEGRNVTLTCQINFTCFSDTPALIWAPQIGQINIQYLDKGEGVWQVESNQVFTPSRSHYGTSIICHAEYPLGAKSQSVSSPLIIIYKPEILQKSLCRKKLHKIECQCMVNAYPNASISWHLGDRHNSHLMDLFNVNVSYASNLTMSTLVGMVVPTGEILCSATNQEGSASLKLPFYAKPQILQESQCRRMWKRTKCQCVVNANPPASVTWHLMELNISKTGYGFILNSSSVGDIMVATLDGMEVQGGNILCMARNEEGSASRDLTVHEEKTIHYLISGVTVAFLLLGLAVAVIVWRKCRSKQETPGESALKTNHSNIEQTNTNRDTGTYYTKEDDIFYVNTTLEQFKMRSKGSPTNNCQSTFHESYIYGNI